MENKKSGDDIFDRLNTSILNQYLNTLMDGLTAKVWFLWTGSFKWYLLILNNFFSFTLYAWYKSPFSFFQVNNTYELKKIIF